MIGRRAASKASELPSGTAFATDGDLGPANSPGERRLVAELLKPSLGDVPDWSSVLIGPALRGTEVTVR